MGRSQILNYLSRLSDDYHFILVSFEKSLDMSDKQAVEDLRSECDQYGITWKPQIYHHRPRFLATAWDLLVLLCVTLRFSSRREVQLIHCRSYIPAIVAWLCGKVTRKPFIFDMRAIWPDELVTAGRLSEGAVTYNILKWFERRLLRNATKVISLTDAAVEYLLDKYSELTRDQFEVITTCVDINHFNVPERLSASGNLAQSKRETFVVGTMGTLLSGWFYLDAFFAFFLAVKQYLPEARVSIITRDDHCRVLEKAAHVGVNVDDINIVAATPAEMPAYLANMDVGIMFYAPDVGRAPTRLAEFLATGVPVVGNHGIGDLGQLINHYEVGVVVKNVYDQRELDSAACQLLEHYDGILARQACRHAADDYFSADQGAERYRRLYESI
ncbi:glycosyl transferase [Litchfieldella qijiaojingensis]|uniref:Glycosyl transferase n=1 Tax=Litchfieldella qijiaojingensis TaxID=980347 RepID=A0ABQ2Z8A6_9GAMM|nr:glycosyl transferase [Halomonas qijiaojingensis]